MTATAFRDSVRTLLRDRLLDAAATVTTNQGWSGVTMARLAKDVGVSRQTVYNELGSKSDIAHELVMRELGRFLAIARSRLVAESDVVRGLKSACEGALAFAHENALLKAALDSAQFGQNDLLPLLTTDSQEVIDTAAANVSQILEEHYGDIGLASDQLRHAADAIIRLLLSHVTRPSGSPSDAAAQIGWIAGRVLAGPRGDS